MTTPTQPVCINRSQFMGSGSTPFLISGRERGDNDDTCMLILADSEAEAHSIFIALGLDLDEEDEQDDNDPKYYIITSNNLTLGNEQA